MLTLDKNTCKSLKGIRDLICWKISPRDESGFKLEYDPIPPKDNNYWKGFRPCSLAIPFGENHFKDGQLGQLMEDAYDDQGIEQFSRSGSRSEEDFTQDQDMQLIGQSREWE